MGIKHYIFKGIFNGDRLIDKEMVITTRDGQVAKVEPPLSFETYKDINRTYKDYYVFPGFIDCHVHLALDGENFTKAKERWDLPDLFREQYLKNLEALKGSGILACRDGGAHCSISLWPCPETLPSIHHTFWALRKEGYYGSFLGPSISNLEDGFNLIKTLATTGAKAIKILLSGIMSFKTYSKVGPCQFTLQETKALVSYAKDLGLPVMAHASGTEAIDLALEAGVTSIEHGYYMTEEQLDLLIKRNIFWVPTIIPVEKHLITCSSEESPIIKKILLNHKERVRQGYERGALLAIGTDAGAQGVFLGPSFLEEMALYNKLGIPVEAILKLATENGAKLLNSYPFLGRIGPGSSSTVGIVKENPLRDFNNISTVTLVTL